MNLKTAGSSSLELGGDAHEHQPSLVEVGMLAGQSDVVWSALEVARAFQEYRGQNMIL